MAGSCEHGNEPSGSIKAGHFLASWATFSFSRGTGLHRVSWVVRLVFVFRKIHRVSVTTEPKGKHDITWRASFNLFIQSSCQRKRQAVTCKEYQTLQIPSAAVAVTPFSVSATRNTSFGLTVSAAELQRLCVSGYLCFGTEWTRLLGDAFLYSRAVNFILTN